MNNMDQFDDFIDYDLYNNNNGIEIETIDEEDNDDVGNFQFHMVDNNDVIEQSQLLIESIDHYQSYDNDDWLINEQLMDEFNKELVNNDIDIDIQMNDDDLRNSMESYNGLNSNNQNPYMKNKDVYPNGGNTYPNGCEFIEPDDTIFSPNSDKKSDNNSSISEISLIDQNTDKLNKIDLSIDNQINNGSQFTINMMNYQSTEFIENFQLQNNGKKIKEIKFDFYDTSNDYNFYEEFEGDEKGEEKEGSDYVEMETIQQPKEIIKIKRKPIVYTENDILRAINYINQYNHYNIEKISIKLPETISIQGKVFNILPFKEWQLEYFQYQLPNNIQNVNILLNKFNDSDWKYYCNYIDQPHYEINNKSLPLRYCKQIGNFYEPFIIRERRKDGYEYTREEILNRKKRYKIGKNKDDCNYIVEAMCPYCPIINNLDNSINDYFYGRNDSEYLHHITKHHGVYSDGTEHPLPKLIVYDNNFKYFAYCECGELTKIKKLGDNNNNNTGTNGNKFLSYLRHCLTHLTNSKNGKGSSRLNRRELLIKEIENSNLIYEC